MSDGVDGMPDGIVVIVGSTREEATKVFGAHFESFVATTYDDMPADLGGRTPAFMGVAAGPGMGAAVSSALTLKSSHDTMELAVEIPSDLAMGQRVREQFVAARILTPQVRRFRDRPCLLVGQGSAGERRDDWFLHSLFIAGSHAPDTRQSEQGRIGADSERQALRTRADESEQKIGELRTALRTTQRELREAEASRSARALSARVRSGRFLSLALRAGGITVLLVGLPIVFGLIGGADGALTGVTLSVTTLGLGCISAITLRLWRRVGNARRETERHRRAAIERHRLLRTRLAALEKRQAKQDKSIRAGPTTVPATAALLNRTKGTITQQVQATLNLFSAVPVQASVPTMGLWTAAPDFIHEVVDLLRLERPRAVVEAGSGVSTLFLALAAKQHKIDVRIVALEHDKGYAAKTRDLLDRHGVGDLAEVRFAPLARTRVPGHNTPWYDESALEDLSDIGLVLVDGPPGTTGPAPRYPLVPLLKDRFAERCTIVVDDTTREADRDVVERWRQELPDFEVEMLRLQKGAAVLRRAGRPATTPA